MIYLLCIAIGIFLGWLFFKPVEEGCWDEDAW